ncbi:MAG: GNAT family N-acetyltransferase [Candidatus Velthaea sp.]|jgi:ribosomal protein S18 acetylase RimI-like enzyme
MGLVATDALRAERAEAAYWATYARNIPTTDDTRDTGAIPVAGGYAICLQGTSIHYGLGVGISRPLRADDLQVVDEFYGSRRLPSRLELHPLVAERDAAIVARWGYLPERAVVILEREIGADPAIPLTFGVETLTTRKLEWTELVVAGLMDTVPEADLGCVRRTAYVCASAASALVAIRVDGRLAGGGALGVTGDAAFLFCASTLPEYRRRGVHTALIGARLALGRSRGATYAIMTAAPDSDALASAQAAGFTATYVRQRLQKSEGLKAP